MGVRNNMWKGDTVTTGFGICTVVSVNFDAFCVMWVLRESYCSENNE